MDGLDIGCLVSKWSRVYHEASWESKDAEVERFDVGVFSERSDVSAKQSMI